VVRQAPAQQVERAVGRMVGRGARWSARRRGSARPQVLSTRDAALVGVAEIDPETLVARVSGLSDVTATFILEVLEANRGRLIDGS
jgi:hypothetical protein